MKYYMQVVVVFGGDNLVLYCKPTSRAIGVGSERRLAGRSNAWLLDVSITFWSHRYMVVEAGIGPLNIGIKRDCIEKLDVWCTKMVPVLRNNY